MKIIKIYILVTIAVILQSSLNAQCYLDRHNTTWYDSWTSCDMSISPNAERGEGHWIMYNLGYNYNLKTSHWWNYNNPDELENGVSRIAVDLSSDGVNWNNWGEFSLDMATGQNQYEGEEGPDFGGAYAQYVLLTVLETHGGNCAGLSEVKIDVDISLNTKDVAASYCMDIKVNPNPFNSHLNLDVQSNCKGDVSMWVEDAMGRKITTISDFNNALEVSNWDAGIYFIVAISENTRIRKRVVKI